MFSDESNRSGIRSSRLALKLRRRQESKDRQSNAREEVLEDISTASDESPGEEFWIDDHFQHTLKGLVRTFIEAENELYALQGCMKRLEQSKSEGKVPSGMKIHRINAKGRNRQPLQEMFDTILLEAELKLLNATIKTLQQEEQHCLNHCTSEKRRSLQPSLRGGNCLKLAMPPWTSMRTILSPRKNVLLISSCSSALQ